MSLGQILIVDDEPKLVRLVREIMLATGYETLAASNGDQAIEMVALEQPDLVLLDIVLSGKLDGYQVAKRIREFYEKHCPEKLNDPNFVTRIAERYSYPGGYDALFSTLNKKYN